MQTDFNGAIEHFTNTCKSCGNQFQSIAARAFGARIGGPRALCDRCMADREQNETRERERVVSAERWKKVCPKLFRQGEGVTDLQRLPKSEYARVMAWRFGQRGLLLHGPTQKGKTRCAYELLKRLVFEDKKSVRAIHSIDFSHECARLFATGGGEEWIEEFRHADVVYIDDFAKCRLSERVEAELYGVIEMRIMDCKPTILTMNFDAASMKKTMTPRYGGPLAERLKRYFDHVNFK